MGRRSSSVRSLRGAFPGQVTPEQMAAGRFIEIPALHQTVAPPPLILQEKGIELKLSGSEVYYTACSLLVTFKNSCSKLHCQKVSV